MRFTNQTEDMDTDTDKDTDTDTDTDTAPGSRAPVVLYWLPFYDVSGARHDLHPFRGPKQADEMTHYCHTPELWAPVYAGIARGLRHDRWRKRQRKSTRKEGEKGD